MKRAERTKRICEYLGVANLVEAESLFLKLGECWIDGISRKSKCSLLDIIEKMFVITERAPCAHERIPDDAA